MKSYDFQAELAGDERNERRLLFKEIAVLALLVLLAVVRECTL